MNYNNFHMEGDNDDIVHDPFRDTHQDQKELQADTDRFFGGMTYQPPYISSNLHRAQVDTLIRTNSLYDPN